MTPAEIAAKLTKAQPRYWFKSPWPTPNERRMEALRLSGAAERERKVANLARAEEEQRRHGRTAGKETPDE